MILSRFCRPPPGVLGPISLPSFSSPFGERRHHHRLQQRSLNSGAILPGLALSATTAAAGFLAAGYLGEGLLMMQGLTPVAGTPSPISGIPCAILLGAAVNNFVQPPKATFDAGQKFCSTTVLRAGIIAVGAKLSFVELTSTGMSAVPVVVSSVAAGLFYIPMASRYLSLDPKLGKLIAAGTSICGVTAITALSPAINASSKQTAIAVANVVAFGTMGMLAYPYLLHTICGSNSEQVGMILGVAIHDTSQVLGGSMTYAQVYGDEVALKVAAITKLTRNLLLAGVIPGLTYLHHQEMSGASKTSSEKEGDDGTDATSATADTTTAISGLATFQKYVPSFLVAFIGMAGLRTGGDLYFLDNEVYTQGIKFVGSDISKYCLGTAMAAVGLSTSAKSLQGVGPKPFLVGGSGALVVGGTGFFVSNLVC